MSEDEDLQSKTVIVAPGMGSNLADAPRAKLACTDPSVLDESDDTEIPLDGLDIAIGRGDDNRVTLKADGVSRRHARLFPHDEGWYIEDLGSTNGIRVNGEPVDKMLLRDGDTVEIGFVPYVYRIEARPEEEGDKPTMEFARPGPAGTGEHRSAARPAAYSGSDALLWSLVFIGAGALVFAIFTVISV